MLLLLIVGLLGAAPVEQTTADGIIDWTAREIRVVGVGTPVILSHTGAVTPRDPYEGAKDDASKRLAQVFGALAVDGRPAADVPALDGIRALALRTYRSAPPIHFSDGTVHLKATASFAWGPAHAGAPTERGAHAPTGLVLRLKAPLTPRLRLRLAIGPDLVQWAGLPGDPIGAAGVVWARGDVAAAKARVGPRPLVVDATEAPPGTLNIRGDLAPLLKNGLPGLVAVVLP